MQQNIFKAALAGLLHELEAERNGTIIAELILGDWCDDVSKEIVGHARQLVAGNQFNQQHASLESIFTAVRLPVSSTKACTPPDLAKKHIHLKPLSIEEHVLFPHDKPDNPEARQKLWDKFLQDAKQLKTPLENDKDENLQEAYLNNLLNLVQRYFWCVPSRYYAEPNVSIYDHSRMTAAIAACLAGRNPLPSLNSSDEVALLVGGDISGVQNFIYTITSQGATSGLRGRSMYLQLLTEVTCRYLLDQLGLPLTNVIYAGGGHFYLLAPIGCEDVLKDARKYISQVLLHHHGGDLYLALEHVTIKANKLQNKAFSELWQDELGKALQRAKHQQFSELDKDDMFKLFAPQEHGGNEDKECSVCNREHLDTETKPDEEHRKCPVCRAFEELGKDLRKAQFMCLDRLTACSQFAENDPPGDYSIILSNFGYRVKLLDSLHEAVNLESKFQHRFFLALNDEALVDLRPTTNQTTGRLMLVNVTPILKYEEHKELSKTITDLPHYDSVKPFEALAKQSTGINRLGILRMDVDNLGKIFSKGLGDNSNLQRVATLSFSMKLFFEGWLENIAREVNQNAPQNKGKIGEQKHDLIYSIYSGGDDIFFVGAWDLMPVLAHHISQNLTEYAGGHPDIHLSGGIALVPQKYPLYQAADDAGDAEKKAKGKRPSGSEKNALTFLGQVIPWEIFANVESEKNKLQNLVESNKVPRALLQRLIQLQIAYNKVATERAEEGQEDQVYWGPWHWQSAYSLIRMARQRNKTKNEIDDLYYALHLDKFRYIEQLGLAARWAELLLRNEHKTKKGA
jgi:CRISPR-associated protein Csm1